MTGVPRFAPVSEIENNNITDANVGFDLTSVSAIQNQWP